jgi:hypothetical protein
MRRGFLMCLVLAPLACFEDPALDGDSQAADTEESDSGDGDGDPTGDGDGDPTGDGDGDGDGEPTGDGDGDGDGDGEPGDGDGDGDGDPTPCGDGIISPGLVCFEPGALLPTSDVAQDVAAAQLDNDDPWELVVMATDALYVHADLGLGSWNPQPVSVGGGEFGNVMEIQVVDLDGDDWDDVVANSPLDGHVLVTRGDGMGSLSFPSSLVLASPAELVVAAHLQMVPSEFHLLTVRSSGNQDVYLGNGTGAFVEASFNWSISASQPSDALPFDVDADGDDDVFVASSAGPSMGVRLALANADATQQGSALSTPQTQPTSTLAIGDVDGDGDPDLVAARFDQPIVDVLPGNGSATFNPPMPIALDDDASGLVVADVDLDGMADIIVSYDSKPELDVFRSEGGFEFEPGVLVALPNPGRVRAAPDLDGDGVADLFVVPGSEAIVIVLSDP